jgi:hypothetical protein
MQAQNPVITGQNQKFIHYDENAGLVLTESLEPGMTLYSLAKKYNLTVDQLLSSNQGLDPNTVPLGYPVNIPLNSKNISFEPPPTGDYRIWLSYRVQPKETLYRISKTYLNTTAEVVTTLNPSIQQGLKIGQVLHLGWLMLPEKSDQEITSGILPDSLQLVPKDFITDAHKAGQIIHEQKGLAVWKPGNPTSNYYVLHPTAKLGSYMEITNPMLHRTITAKVAGHIPPGLYQSHVGIVVSPSTARALGILDQQFFARWRFIE